MGKQTPLYQQHLDANGKIVGKHVSSGIGRPHFWDRARYYNEENRLAAALDASQDNESGEI